jgi:hypothetical protein
MTLSCQYDHTIYNSLKNFLNPWIISHTQMRVSDRSTKFNMVTVNFLSIKYNEQKIVSYGIWFMILPQHCPCIIAGRCWTWYKRAQFYVYFKYVTFLNKKNSPKSTCFGIISNFLFMQYSAPSLYSHIVIKIQNVLFFSEWPEKSGLWIRIQRLCGSGSVLGIRIRLQGQEN